MSERFAAIVIGSGFGGSVAACRLAQAGEKVLVLERGKRWQTEEFPRALEDQWLFDVDEPEDQHGWIDLRLFRHIAVAQGAGVGGGSLIYANVSVPAEPFVFETGWPPEITHAVLAPYYATVGKRLDVQELPAGQETARLQLVRDAAAAVGDASRFRKLPLAVRFDPGWTYSGAEPGDASRSRFDTNAFGRRQGTCIHCGNCD
ncbi:MAG: NAD(P)-binding protein, partial [Nevskiales bacterium]